MSWECTIEATTVREPWLSRNLPRIPPPHEPLGAQGPNARKVFGAISPLPHGRGLG